MGTAPIVIGIRPPVRYRNFQFKTTCIDAAAASGLPHRLFKLTRYPRPDGALNPGFSLRFLLFAECLRWGRVCPTARYPISRWMRKPLTTGLLVSGKRLPADKYRKSIAARRSAITKPLKSRKPTMDFPPIHLSHRAMCGCGACKLYPHEAIDIER
jgi:hypothetical protein